MNKWSKSLDEKQLLQNASLLPFDVVFANQTLANFRVRRKWLKAKIQNITNIGLIAKLKNTKVHKGYGARNCNLFRYNINLYTTKASKTCVRQIIEEIWSKYCLYEGKKWEVLTPVTMSLGKWKYEDNIKNSSAHIRHINSYNKHCSDIQCNSYIL